MNALRIGSLFSGYGGLDIGVQQVLGGDVAWHVEFDSAPSRILAHHWPDVPNYGDITDIKWTPDCPYCGQLTAVYGPVDDTRYHCRLHGYLPDSIRELDPESHRIPKRVHVMTGGFPCQDVSLAGLRRGLSQGTRSGLWSEFARAIDALRPQLVVIENVRGLLSAEATSPVESDPWAMGDGDPRLTLRALGAVLGDLAELGYDAEWCGVRAADAGAPHGRYRIFILAYPSGEQRGIGHGDDVQAGGGAVRRLAPAGGSALEDAYLAARSEWGQSAPGQEEGGRPRADAGRRGGAPSADAGGQHDERRGVSGVVASEGGLDHREAPGPWRDGGSSNDSGQTSIRWGAYEPAVRRWEAVIGRVAPTPTNADGKAGGDRLSAQFVEWMMGLEPGHVTDVGLSRNEQLKALGNGVVPQQAALALSVLLQRQAVAA